MAKGRKDERKDEPKVGSARQLEMVRNQRGFDEGNESQVFLDYAMSFCLQPELDEESQAQLWTPGLCQEGQRACLTQHGISNNIFGAKLPYRSDGK